MDNSTATDSTSEQPMEDSSMGANKEYYEKSEDSELQGEMLVRQDGTHPLTTSILEVTPTDVGDQSKTLDVSNLNKFNSKPKRGRPPKTNIAKGPGRPAKIKRACTVFPKSQVNDTAALKETLTIGNAISARRAYKKRNTNAQPTVSKRSNGPSTGRVRSQRQIKRPTWMRNMDIDDDIPDVKLVEPENSSDQEGEENSCSSTPRSPAELNATGNLKVEDGEDDSSDFEEDAIDDEVVDVVSSSSNETGSRGTRGRIPDGDLKSSVVNFLVGKITNRNMLQVRRELLNLTEEGDYFRMTQVAPLAAGLIQAMFCRTAKSD